MSEEVFGAVVIGGGPAGAVAAATLARAGHRVAVCEQAVFPRFQIGESLLPACNAVLMAIGAWDKIEEAGFIRKLGADFEVADGTTRVESLFIRGFHRAADYTYQVDRARFDQILLEHAAESGAVVFQPVRVVSVAEDDAGWSVVLSDARVLRAPYLIDASGRKAFLGRRKKLGREELPYEPKIAVYGHFRGVGRAEGERGGHTVITRWRDGWFWSIPLDAERTSVGLVAPTSLLRQAGGNPETFFAMITDAAPALTERMRRAERMGALHVTADYTYAHTRFAGDRYFLAGDAACFIDPIFSSGVCLALKSGYEAGMAVADGLRSGGEAIPAPVQASYTRRFRHDVRIMRGLIDTFYDRRGIEVFLNPTSKWRLFDAINTIVGGRTALNWALRWRYALFLQVVRLQRRIPIVPRLREEALGSPLVEAVRARDRKARARLAETETNLG